MNIKILTCISMKTMLHRKHQPEGYYLAGVGYDQDGDKVELWRSLRTDEQFVDKYIKVESFRVTASDRKQLDKMKVVQLDE